MDKDEFYLRRCPFMVGMNEAWIIEKQIYVSPAIFQLLTDDKDLETMKLVANQLIVKPASYSELAMLVKTREPIATFAAEREIKSIPVFKSFF